MTGLLDRLAELQAAATPGPWAIGYLAEAVIGWGKLPDDKCAYCTPRGGPVIGEGVGKNGPTHKHLVRFGTDIAGADGEQVAGMWDYEAGGIEKESDTALIVAAVNALPALLQVARAAADVQTWHENWGLFDIDDSAWIATRDELEAALASLGDAT